MPLLSDYLLPLRESPTLQRLAHYWHAERATLLIEWAVIWVIVFFAVRFLRGARGSRAIKVIATPIVLGALVFLLLGDNDKFQRLSIFYTNFLLITALGLLIVFQPELRRSLVQLGEFRFLSMGRSARRRTIDALCAGTEYLAKHRIGALIAVERNVPLAAHLEGAGVQLDAHLSKELLATLFWPGSMLHDLGVLVRGERIAAAGVQFPLADADLLPQELGSRHRAALGLSLGTDAMIIVVSEETGVVSLAYKGHLQRHLSPADLRTLLEQGLPKPRLLSTLPTAEPSVAAVGVAAAKPLESKEPQEGQP